MAEIIWSEPALDDLEKIADYITLSNPFAASKLVQRVFAVVDLLVEFPESGREPVELEGFNYREVVVNPCRVFYRIEGETIYIVHVFRQEQDVRRYILMREKNG